MEAVAHLALALVYALMALTELSALAAGEPAVTTASSNAKLVEPEG